MDIKDSFSSRYFHPEYCTRDGFDLKRVEKLGIDKVVWVSGKVWREVNVTQVDLIVSEIKKEISSNEEKL